MPSKRLSTMLLCGATLTGLGVCAANAGLLIDVRAVTLNGSTNLGAGNSPKAMVNVHVGDTIGLRVLADVTGSDQTKFQCLQSLSGSFLSSGGGTQGNLVLAPAGLIQPFNVIPSSVGQATDLDGDGDLDIGSNNPSDPTGYWAIRAETLTGPHSTFTSGEVIWRPEFPPTPIPGGTEYTVTDNLRFVVTALGSPAAVNFRNRASNTGGLWAENANEVSTDNGDGTTAFGYTGGTTFTDTSNVLSGAPVTIGVPEPAALSLASLSALGLLARRRT